MKKNIWPNFQRILELPAQNIVTKLSKAWVRDPEKTYSGSRIQDPGVKKTSDPGSRFPVPGSESATLLPKTMMRKIKQ
jgi:hypothetical protein